MKRLILLLHIFILGSCTQTILKYDEIDFEAKKVVVSSWSDFDEPVLKRISTTEKSLYKFYESEIKQSQNDMIYNMKFGDSLVNYKHDWIKIIEKRQEERLAEVADSNNILMDVYYENAESEYNEILRMNKYKKGNNLNELDSLKAKYSKISEDDKYFEINYEITGYSTSMGTNMIQNFRVWVDDKSKIFKYLFLDLPQPQ